MPGFILNDGAVVPPSVYSDMNTVLNKKLGTSQVYPARDWAAIVKDLVPLPLKSASGSIAHFEDGADTVPLKSCTLTLAPTQSGTGDPSPTNPRPITGVNSINIYHSGADTSDPETETLSLGETVYGGEVEAIGGTLTNKCGIVLDLSALSWTYQSANNRFIATDIASLVKAPPNNSTVVENALCEIYKVDISNNTASSAYDNIIAVSSAGNIQIRDTSLNGNLDALATRLNGIKFVYPLATPVETTIDPHTINSRYGVNNLWHDGNGDTAVEYYADPTLSTQ